MIIYGLCDPSTGQLRYVGKTGTALKRRLQKHVSNAPHEKRCRRAAWVLSLVKRGLMPEAFVIEEVQGDGDTEEQHHIAQFRSIGCDLTNGTTGGDGGRTATPQTRAAMSAAQFARGHKHSSETRQKMSEVRLGMKFTPEHVENMRKSRLGFKQDPAHQAKMTAAASAARSLKKRTK